MKISILVDVPNSWILPWVKILKDELIVKGNEVNFVKEANLIEKGDVAFLLGCVKIVPNDVLTMNNHNIVVHPSALPKGKGFSPLAWQIIEGKNEIPVSLFEAVPEADAGDIYLQDTIYLNGDELNDEIKEKQGKVTVSLCLRFIDEIQYLKPQQQSGNETFYPRRTEKDSELDPNKTIVEQFNLLRVVDNERYPAFFIVNDKKYIIKINKT
jgi:methionyl-tRNA formyltransferase